MLSGTGGIGGGGGTWSKPAALVCHICGRLGYTIQKHCPQNARLQNKLGHTHTLTYHMFYSTHLSFSSEYGTTSLKIHIPQCEKMWIEREKLKDRKDRRPVPKPAAGMTGMKLNPKDADSMAAYNAAATQQFNERALVPCQNCGRTFFEDRLAIHLRSCRPGNEAARVGTGRIKSASESVAAATPLKAKGPGQTYAGGGIVSPSSSLSPPSGGGVMNKRSPTSASAGGVSKPRGAVSFADTSAPPTARPKVTPVKQSGGTWEDDLNDELAADEPPAKSYAIPTDDGAGDGEVGACSLCGRNFNLDRLSKHETICRKQQASDAKRQKRIAAKQATLPQPGTQKSANTEAWKSKHNEFQAAIQYAKKLTAMQKSGASLANLPPPPRSENPDYVTCPHCDRRFNQQAAERHIPACANTINKPKAVNRNGPTKPPAAGSMAAIRAKAAGPPPAVRQQSQVYGGYGGGASAYGGGYDEYSSRPGTSSGSSMAPPRSSAGRAPPAAMRAAAPSALAPPRTSSSNRPQAQRSPSSAIGGGRGGGVGSQEDLHSKISQLTQTVAQLSKVVLKSPNGGRGGGGGGVSCRSCGEINPVATAKFCMSCGSRC